MLKHALGLRLGKTLREIDAIPYDEFIGWIAFLDSEE
jgi:hypothetical protein